MISENRETLFHPDAEAQAQVQVPQVQVGEVSDVNSNVNNVNSPVVVS